LKKFDIITLRKTYYIVTMDEEMNMMDEAAPMMEAEKKAEEAVAEAAPAEDEVSVARSLED